MSKKIAIITILVIALVAVAGAVVYLAQQRQEKEQVATIPEEFEIDTSDWKIYRNEEYRFEFRYPGEIEARWDILNNETTRGCVLGEQIRFYFYKKGDMPPKPAGVLGKYLFRSDLTSADYRRLEYSTKDRSFCGPVFDFPVEEITLDIPFQLFATTLNVPKPIQSLSCSIYQTAEFKVEKFYPRERYTTFRLERYVGDFPLSIEKMEDWKTECQKVLEENIHEIESEIKLFDLVVKSIKFWE